MTRRPKPREPLVLDQHNDGPPEIQRVAVVTLDGEIIRDALVQREDRRDPTDETARFKKTGARMIRGWRRVWTIDALHKSSPLEITEAHVKAAERLVADHQRREGVVSGGRPSNGESDMGPIDVRVAAAIRYEEAMEAVGPYGKGILIRVAVANWTVTKLAERMGINRNRAFGRLTAALERLREHYDAGKKRKPRSPALAPVVAVPMLEPEVTGLPAERSGRWDRKKSSRLETI